jgi:transposase InsO family protein
MAEHMQTELVQTALQADLGQRRPSGDGLIFQVDHGSQYAILNFRAALNASSRMSRLANCWGNAVAKSFYFAPLNAMCTQGIKGFSIALVQHALLAAC